MSEVVGTKRTQSTGRRSRDPVTFVLDLFNVWTGIALAGILFLYCSIGSGTPDVRKLPWLEMTEFEWFNWWPFAVLIGLFSINMVLVTVRRIPLRKINAGVWMIHSGIIMMTLGSYYYFTTKVEGDAPVFRRQVRVELPGMDKPLSLIALPGSHAHATVSGKTWEFQVQSTNTNWPILSEKHKGEVAYAVNVMVTPPDGESFIRQLLDGYPQYTEDVIPGKGRAVKSTGKKLLRDELSLSLEYHPTDYFYVMDTSALYVRRVGETEWVQRPIEGLPRYNERIGSRDQVFFDPHQRIPLRPIDLDIPPASDGDALSDASVHVTGFLRYAHLERRWRDGSSRGDRLNPFLKISLSSDQAAKESFELIAFDPARRTAGNGTIEFTWLRDASQVASLPTDSRATLRIKLADSDDEMVVPITADTLGGDFLPIGDSVFSYRVKNVQDRLTIPGRDAPVSIAIIELKTPETTITRWVADQPGMSRDMGASQGDPHGGEPATPTPPDSRVVMTYQPGSAPLIFAAHPGGLHFVYNGAEGRAMSRPVHPGESIEVMPGLTLRVETFLPNAVAEVRPVVVPPSSRQRGVKGFFSMIRLEINTGGSAQTEWVSFNRYAFPNRQYAYQGRFTYLPQRFKLADGGQVEVMFSRERQKLPASIALDDFEIDAHFGGYTGNVSTIRNYISHLRFNDGSGWTKSEEIQVNAPTALGGFWYFQSMWDKPQDRNPGGGMNYTGLGVGNRNGVYIQLAGCCIAVVGMLFAFYVKPMMKRKRAAQSRARVSRSTVVSEHEEVAAELQQSVGV
jgi:hypothetical protein